MRRGFVSVGYEGRSLDEFVEYLQAQAVTVVADVRLNALSRRRGFNKTALREALATAGIGYVHLRALGNPPENRSGFRTNDPTPARDRFAERLRSPIAQAELAELASMGSDAVVAVLCVEQDSEHCHRQLVIEAVTRAPRRGSVSRDAPGR
jgi:uncharacterized protein (DUF488 family)